MNIQIRPPTVSHQLDPQSASFLFSPTARMRHVRKLPSIDDRSLIAAPLDSFRQPTYVLDQAIHLAQDVEELKKDVVPLRQQYELIRTNIDYTDDDQEIDPLEEISKREGYAKVHRLQDQCRQLDFEITKMNSAFTDESRYNLNAHVTSQYEAKAQADLNVVELNEAIKIQTETLERLMKSELKDKIIGSDAKIKELVELKSELISEEAELLEKHQKLLKHPPEYEEKLRTLAFLQKQLKSIEHSSAQKKVDFAKYSKQITTQKDDMKSVILSQKAKTTQERSRDIWRRNYRKKAEEFQRQKEESQLMQVDTINSNNNNNNKNANPYTHHSNNNNFENDSQISEPDSSAYEQEIVKRRIKRKHRHYHDHKNYPPSNIDDIPQLNEEEEEVNETNEEKVQQLGPIREENDAEVGEEEVDVDIEETSSVSPGQSGIHCSDIESVEPTEPSFVEMNDGAADLTCFKNEEKMKTNDKIIKEEITEDDIKIGHSSGKHLQLEREIKEDPNTLGETNSKEENQNESADGMSSQEDELASDEFTKTLEVSKNESEKGESEKGESEKEEPEKTELEKTELEKTELEKTELEKTEIEKTELEKTVPEKIEYEKAESKEVELDRVESEKVGSDIYTNNFKSNENSSVAECMDERSAHDDNSADLVNFDDGPVGVIERLQTLIEA